MKSNKHLLTAIICVVCAVTHTQAQKASFSPNNQYRLERTSIGSFEIVDLQGQTLGEPASPKHNDYLKILSAWTHDSQKVAVIAMRPKIRDLYILGTQHNYAPPCPLPTR